MKFDRTLSIAVVAIGSLLMAQSAFAGGGQPPSLIFISPDTNGDGASDPVLEDVGDTGYAIAYEMSGLTQLQAAGVPGTYGSFTTIDWDDVDGDGKDDKIIQHTNGFEMAFTAPPDITTTGPGAWSTIEIPGTYGDFETLGFFDVDGDGKEDKIMEDTVTGWSAAIRTNALPFDDAVSIPGSYGNFETSAFIDIDGDGNADKVMEDSVTGYTVVTLLEPVIASSFVDEIPGSYGDFVTLAYADVNGDGIQDKIMQLENLGADDGYTIAILLNADLSSSIIELPGLYDDQVSLGFPDLNGDGQADQVIASGSAPTDDVIGCVYGDATGAQMVVSCGAYTPVPVTQTFVGFADLNGDKKVDRVMRETSSGDLYAILVDGTTEVGGPSIIVSAPASTYSPNAFDDFWEVAP